jgi:hypothetical protein
MDVIKKNNAAAWAGDQSRIANARTQPLQLKDNGL